MLSMTGSDCAENSVYALRMPSHHQCFLLYKHPVHQESHEDGDWLLMEYWMRCQLAA